LPDSARPKQPHDRPWGSGLYDFDRVVSGANRGKRAAAAAS
jgi:hypothetical protein